MNLKIKIVTGFNNEQHYTIDGDEAHKAYYLFEHPEERGIFSNGVAVIGKYIQSIQPDYNATMGWNPTYKLGDDDWEEIRGMGMDKRLNNLLETAKEVNKKLTIEKPELLNEKLSDIVKYLLERQPEIKKLSDELANKFKI